jgi:hypothetical protein
VALYRWKVVEIRFCQYKMLCFRVSLISTASLASVWRNLRKISEVAPNISIANGFNSTPTA